MKTLATAAVASNPLAMGRVSDYLELTKPRVSVLVLFTVAAGAWLAAGGTLDPIRLVHVLVGTALVAGGASALNQCMERQSDALMRRTELRPLPARRLQPGEAIAFGFTLGVAGVGYLVATLGDPVAAGVAAAAFCSYVFVYTPLKRKTTFNTLVGAVPGALPPVIGWAAFRHSPGAEITLLFIIVFLWQVPHFLAIAWIHREDYARAGLCMLPVVDKGGVQTSRQMVAYCLALIPASLSLVLVGLAGPVYFAGALILSLVFLGHAFRFTRCPSDARARRVLRASLMYLPTLLVLLVIDGPAAPALLAFWR
jgi:protoheme IX farnesyltransferase